VKRFILDLLMGKLTPRADCAPQRPTGKIDNNNNNVPLFVKCWI